MTTLYISSINAATVYFGEIRDEDGYRGIETFEMALELYESLGQPQEIDVVITTGP